MSKEKINVEEETIQTEWTEELKVAGKDLLDTVKELLHEAAVRRIVIRNEDKRILLEIPIVLGVAGIALFPLYASVGLVAALVTDCTIEVVRVTDQNEAAAS